VRELFLVLRALFLLVRELILVVRELFLVVRELVLVVREIFLDSLLGQVNHHKTNRKCDQLLINFEAC